MAVGTSLREEHTAGGSRPQAMTGSSKGGGIEPDVAILPANVTEAQIMTLTDEDFARALKTSPMWKRQFESNQKNPTKKHVVICCCKLNNTRDCDEHLFG